MNARMDFIRNAWKLLAGELVEPRTTTPSLALPFKLKNQLYGGAYDQWPPLRAWLVADPSRDVNGTVDDYERTLLLYAAIAGSTNHNYGVEASDFALARALLEYGADPNISDNYGMTPLHYAARGSRNWGGPQPNQSAAMVSLLIQHGADVNARGATMEGWVDPSWSLAKFTIHPDGKLVHTTPLSQAFGFFNLDNIHTKEARHIISRLLRAGASMPSRNLDDIIRSCSTWNGAHLIGTGDEGRPTGWRSDHSPYGRRTANYCARGASSYAAGPWRTIPSSRASCACRTGCSGT